LSNVAKDLIVQEVVNHGYDVPDGNFFDVPGGFGGLFDGRVVCRRDTPQLARRERCTEEWRT
jgi:hypothetical protein